jgi:futalosine hydrolase
MSVLIVAATEQEIKPLFPKWSTADILITGVGVATTVFHLMQKLMDKDYERIYQIGIAGKFETPLSLGSACLIESDCFADLGAMENSKWHTINQLGFSNPDEPPFIEGKLFNPHIQKIQFPKRTAATVNRLTDNKEEIEILRSSHGAELESMEGAAFHYVALQLNIPFFQIRGISNRVGVRDKREWKIQEAIDASCTLFEKLEHHLNQR